MTRVPPRRVTLSQGLCCRQEGVAAALGSAPRGKVGGVLVGAGAVAEQGPAAEQRPAPRSPPLAYAERLATPCAKPYCVFVTSSPPFEKLFSNDSNKCIFFGCWLPPVAGPPHAARAVAPPHAVGRGGLMAAGTARVGGTRVSVGQGPSPEPLPARKVFKTLVRKLLIKTIPLFLSGAGELEAALGPRPSK